MTGQQLRNSILQEAIQGRLVPNVLQPGEKTGEELLKDILAEHQKKENEEKGKKTKKLTLSTIEEEPWELPEGWCWTLIGDIFDHSAGKSLNSSKQSIGKVYPYLTTSNVYWEGINFDKVKEMPFTEDEYKKCSAIKNDILVCEGGDVGRSCIWTYDYAIGLQNHVHRLRAIKNVEVKFFNYVFRFYKATGIITAKGIGIGGFSANALKGLSVPLPPLSIQKAIVEKIEELLPLIDEYDKAAVELETLNKILPDKLRKSVLQEAIHGNLVSNDIPEGEATAQGNRSHAEGSATSIGTASHAEGFGRASGQGSHAEGTGQTGASAYASHAEGSGSQTIGSYSHAEGCSSITMGEHSHAEGLNGYSYGMYAHCEGTSGAPISITIDGGSGTEADPYTTQSNMSFLRAGQLVITNTESYGWIESLNTVSRTLVIPNLTLNAGDVITVYRGTAFGYGSHAEGKETIARDANAHAEGSCAQALGQSSHAEGSYTQAVGAGSHSEGSSCASYEANSHAEGSNTKTFGYYSHAEGQYGIATGNGSHVEGTNTSINYDTISFSANVSGNTYTTASSILINPKLQVGSKLSSSVHGSDLYTVTAIDRTNSTVTFDAPLPDLSQGYYIFCLAATGEGSHAEGNSVAIGKGSHAEGLNCYASGHYAHAEGVGTIANSNYQHVDGQYNVADSSGIGTYVHITGIGSSESDRKNGFTINNVGNGWFAGNITANGGSLTLHDSTGNVTVTAAQLRQLLAMLS